MIQRILLFFISVICINAVQAQTPVTPSLSHAESHPGMNAGLRTCAATTWSAGTSTQALASTAQSNDVEFLCANDIINVTHNGDQNLDASQDPIPATPAGICYVFYNCQPTVTGPDVTHIAGDPCTVNSPTPPYVSLVSSPDIDINGTGSFQNTGLLQNIFNSGNPLQLFFAPITVSEFHDPALNAPEFEAGGSSNDFCVNVNAADAFRVVYLNAITQTNVNNNAGNNCLASFEIAGGLSQYDALNGSTSNYTINIVKSDDASVTGTITSGAATHGSTVTFSVPEAGTYNVSVEDGKSCGATFSVDMTGCTPTTSVSATYAATNPTCTGADNGEIAVNITGGTAPYVISWQLQPAGTIQTTNTSNTSETISNLAPGTYGVTVTDNLNSTDNGSATLTEPAALGASLVNLTQPTCNGLSNGSMEVQVSLGGVVVAPDNTYSFQWSGTTQNTNSITNLTSGSYAVTVTNAAGCTATAATTLSQPAAISAPPIAGTDASCEGQANGLATINASGGTGTLTYAWNTTPAQTTATANNLAPATYIVTVTDASACTYVDSVTIGAATVLTATATATDISCNGANNGQINIQPTAQGVDNGNYSYAWSGNVSSSDNAMGLSAQTYTVTVTDGAQCTATAEATINEPSPINVIASATDESCNVGNDGTISTTVTGGTPLPDGTYNYTWDNNAITANLTGLSGNIYTVTVTDANSCTATTSATVNIPTGPTITGFSTTDVSCVTSTNGAITVNINQGSQAITSYAWSGGGSTSATNNNLSPGSYTVTITDAGGCTVSGTASIAAPPALVQTAAPVTTTPLCPGGGEGTITIGVGGGVPPYNYAWSNGSAGPAFSTLTNLVAGTYVPTITDANGCTLTLDPIEVSDPPAITATFQSVKPVSCFNGVPCDGEATILASGGLSSNYTFTWASGESSTGGSSTAIQLCQGNQNVTITDGYCTVVVEMGADSIPAPQPVTIGGIQTTDASCFGRTDGTATITPSGGAGEPYNIAWSNGQGGATATNLNPSLAYTVTITDNLGCRSIPFTVTVNEPDSLALNVVSASNISCNGENNGSIQVAPTGGNTGNFTYQWFPNTTDTTNVIANLSPGNYAVTVTDARGCTATASSSVIEPAALQFDYTQPKEPTCNGYSTVFAIDTVTGGAGSNYTYTVDGFNHLSTSQAASVFAGTYNVVVSDSLGCQVSDSITVTQPEPIVVELGADTIVVLGDSVLLVPTITPLGVWDSLVWTPSTGLSCTNCFSPMAAPVDDITYRLTVYDERGCFATDTKLVDINPSRKVYIPNIFTPNGDGKNDFFAPLIGTGVQNIDKVIIFDRWGELVYSAKDFVPDPTGNNGWNGYFKGKKAPIGVYIYIIEATFVDGVKLTYKGDVTLLN